jgi:hypothetical protein
VVVVETAKYLRGSLLPTESRALGSTQPIKMSTRNILGGKDGRCVRLTTYHRHSGERHENSGP